MTGLEIFLIAVGIAAVSISFIIGEKIDGNKTAISGFDEEKIKETLKAQVDEAVVDVVDETVEKTAKELDKISNEKIMAVSDYSENVLGEINKNHEEVMFLYSMLNDKEEDIKNTVRDVENVKKSVNMLVKESETAGRDTYADSADMNDAAIEESEAVLDGELAKAVAHEERNKENIKAAGGEDSAETTDADNNNSKILELYKDGFTNIEIAKMLNLGMGEVRLVIDLYKNKVR